MEEKELEKLRAEQRIFKEYEKRLEELKEEREQKGIFDFRGKREIDRKIEEVNKNQEKLFKELRDQYDLKVTNKSELDSIIAEREKRIEKVKEQEEQIEAQNKEALQRGYMSLKRDISQEQEKEKEQDQETDVERSREKYNKKALHELKEKNDKMEIAMRDKSKEELLGEALNYEEREEQQELEQESLEPMEIGGLEQEPMEKEEDGLEQGIVEGKEIQQSRTPEIETERSR